MENMLCSWNPRPPCPSIHLFACLSPSSVCLSSSLGACPLLAPLSGTCFLCCSCLVLSPLFWLPKARLGASLGRLSFPVFAHRHGSGTSSVLNSAQHSVLRRSARRPPIPPTPVLCLAACGGTTYATTAPNLKTSRPHPHTREPVSSLHWTAVDRAGGDTKPQETDAKRREDAHGLLSCWFLVKTTWKRPCQRSPHEQLLPEAGQTTHTRATSPSMVFGPPPSTSGFLHREPSIPFLTILHCRRSTESSQPKRPGRDLTQPTNQPLPP